MSAFEEIETAITKLAELRDKASPFEWRAEPDGDDWAQIRNYNQNGDLITEIAEPLEDDANLIVTLHQTIDAQLSLLDCARGGARDIDRGMTPDEPGSLYPMLDLARAINGTPA